MNKPIVAWVTRHAPTEQQRRDFTGYRIVPVRYRHGSYQFLWFDVLMECGDVPAIVVLTWRNDVRQYAIKHINEQSPDTLVLRALTEVDDRTPTGMYVRQWWDGYGLKTEEWSPRIPA